MALPLYQSLHQAPPVHDPMQPMGNCGLWFERFYDRYQADFKQAKESDNAFSEWLKTFNHLAGDSSDLEAAINRQSLLVKSLNGTEALFTSDWHFVTGMGNPHPLENGFNWHPVWGVPYLPGSGLKGLVRSWVEAWQFDEDNAEAQTQRKQRLLDWFGSEEKHPDPAIVPQTGKVIFFDAIPYKPVRLVSDIMTPHMDKWYAEGGSIENVQCQAEAVPADWHSPTPIYFLAAKAPVFLISVAPRNEWGADEVDLGEVMQCISDALEWLGAGAKTAVGYGDFYQDEAATQRHQQSITDMAQAMVVAAEQSAQLAGLSGIGLALTQYAQQAGWTASKDAFTKPGEIERWLDKLEAEPDASAVVFMRGLMNQHFSGLLANPEKTRGKKNQAVFNLRQQALAKRLNQLIKEG